MFQISRSQTVSTKNSRNSQIRPKKPACYQICYLASNQKMSLNEIYFSPPLLFQISRFQTVLTKNSQNSQIRPKKPARDQICYLASKQSGTLKFETKVGMKSIFHLVTFFDLRPNNRFGRVLAFLGLIWLFWLFLVKSVWDLEIWNKSRGEKYISLNDIF